jgi:limonene-1,2-epoxide hydrolase
MHGVTGDADPGDVRVIDEWATALRRGDVDAAARYFAIPSVAENDPLLINIRNLDDARRFNESLPCGARLVRAETQGQFTTATFRLTERPGPGFCGSGTGEAAQTSFVIRGGKIVEWRRVGTGGEAPGRAV